MSGYQIPTPKEPIADKNGYVTHAWWRWFYNQFLLTGGNQVDIGLPEIEALTFAMGTTTGPDYPLQLSQMRTEMEMRRDMAGPVGQLVARVKTLELQVATIRDTSGEIAALQGEIKTLQTLLAASTPL